MLTIFKKLFGKSAPKPEADLPVPVAATLSPGTMMPTIEVAHLSLAAITARFPEDLKALLVSEPETTATVALPLPTILKQLPAGVVKMSLASLHRQAHGLIKPIPQGDKRMVDVPLAEIFRHLRPDAFRCRAEQRPAYIPESGYSLFGNATNPYAVAPEDDTQPQVLDLSRELPAEVSPEGSRGLKMDDGLREHFDNVSASQSTAAPVASSADFKLETPVSGPSDVAPPAAHNGSHPPAAAPIPKPDGPTLDLPVAPLAAGWPEEIRAAIEGLDPATIVTLPLAVVGAGLSKGRVVFSWGQIHAWLEPAAGDSTVAPADTALLLPLKFVAPSYLAATKTPNTDRKKMAMDGSIPALFSSGREAAVAPAPAPPEPSQEAEAASEPEAVAPDTAAPEPHKAPETIGELFGQPQKRDWTPTEMVAGLTKLPGVAGAIVALQEGLPVAASLPEGVKGEVVAAFLPQIFARLNQYSNEMKLGEVDDMLFTTHGAHCQIYRLGFVYLAVLGKPGESLPWQELRLISEELARQTHK